MKNEAVIVNVCREELLDTKVVYDSLYSERIRGIAIDIFREYDQNLYKNFDENYLLEEGISKLSQLPTVVITYHQAYLTENNLSEIMATTLRNILLIMNGEETPDEISAVLKM